MDEAIRDEQDLRSRKAILEGEVMRVKREIDIIGRPTGVTSAIIILAIYSVLGIVAPVIVMGLALDTWPLGWSGCWLPCSCSACQPFSPISSGTQRH